MNSLYESFDFTGGWQHDQSVRETHPANGPFHDLTSGRLTGVVDPLVNNAVSPPDEWLSTQSAWLQQNNAYHESTCYDFDGLHTLPTYTTAQSSPYDADWADVYDRDQCQSQSSLSETDLDYFPSSYQDSTNYGFSSFSTPPLTSPTSEPSYQRPASTYLIQNYSPSPVSYDNNHHVHSSQPQSAQPINTPPAQDLLPSDPLYPRQQPPRFDGDLYTPTYVRGDGPTRAGWCTQCSSWLTLKDSAYWYHMHFAHGISCATGKHLPVPIRFRATAGAARGVGNAEALCGGCGRWVLIAAGEKGSTAWWRHAYRCKFKDGEAGKERKRGKSASPRKVVARPVIARR